MRFARSWTAPPAIVAEELLAVPDPLLTALRPGPPASGAAVTTSLARSMVPAEDGQAAPRWLLAAQHQSFRQTLAALRRHRGALLADPVGSGKTYVALAVAAAFNNCGPTACLVPATLLSQWEAVAKILGIQVELGSHEQASRGTLPQNSRGAVIIDESHHFRNRSTHRYSNVALWLVDRPALLVTATPIVNQLTDLGNQLHLCVRDNALAMEGIPSLRAMLENGCPHPALGQLVIENEVPIDARPRRISRLSAPAAEACGRLGTSLDLLSRLRLSRNPSIAGLIRRVLLRGAASSPAALIGALQRYRGLLLHARDALVAGRTMQRSELRRFTGDLDDQLVWWELLPAIGDSSDLELADLAELDQVLPAAKALMRDADPKLAGLREILGDTTPALVFTTSRDTVRYIRERLRELRLAWCTGDQAGIGATPMPRSSVLAWFRAGVPSELGPRHLVVTDVAAEGLDLQRAGRIVHYDLPWTPMRLEQREGRAVRLGSRHSEVEVVRFPPPPAIERCLRLEETLERKARLPALAGLGQAARRVWRWRGELARCLKNIDAVSGVASVASSAAGLLAGFALYRPTEPATCISATVGWLDVNGWTEAPEIVAERLAAAAACGQRQRVDADHVAKQMEILAPIIRMRLAASRAGRWAAPDAAPAARKLAIRLGSLIQEAARLRQDKRLLLLERALSFVAGGHTAGEAMLIERIAKMPNREIEPALSRVRPAAIAWELEVRLTGLIVFVEDPSPSPSKNCE